MNGYAGAAGSFDLLSYGSVRSILDTPLSARYKATSVRHDTYRFFLVCFWQSLGGEIW